MHQRSNGQQVNGNGFALGIGWIGVGLLGSLDITRSQHLLYNASSRSNAACLLFTPAMADSLKNRTARGAGRSSLICRSYSINTSGISCHAPFILSCNPQTKLIICHANITQSRSLPFQYLSILKMNGCINIHLRLRRPFRV